MPCYSPNQAFEGPIKDNGKMTIVWKRKDSVRDKEIMLPCGKCVGCRESRSRQWALRCMHEAGQYEENSFITLTYDEENLPPGGYLRLQDFQKFMKRLRKANKHKIRFYHCGEYGEQFKRPHYHALLFNHQFEDQTLLKEANGNKLYTSETLSTLWPMGQHLIGNVTFGSAAYVARYVMKKINGPQAVDHYKGYTPEYTTMSRRPGIGQAWYKKYGQETYRDDFIIENSFKYKPPRYYDNLLDKTDPVLLKSIKKQRLKDGVQMVKKTLDNGKVILVNDNDSFRLRIKEEVKIAQMRPLIRPLERIK